MRTALAAFLLMISPAVCCASETVMDGAHEYASDLRIAAGEVLRVGPGSTLRFAEGTGVKVEGVLVVDGSADGPVTFGPADGSWAGIAAASGGSVRMTEAVIKGADEAVRMSGGLLTVSGLSIKGGTEGVILEAMCDAEIKDTNISGVEKASLTLRQGSRASVENCRLEGTGGIGIKVVGTCPLDVAGTYIKGFKDGVSTAYPGSNPRLAGCKITGCEYGVISDYPQSGPVMDGCELTDNVYAVYAKRLSSPELSGSRVTGNEYGLYATEGSAPKATSTLFGDNGYGVFVTLSSYPVVNGCEFADNRKYAVYLDVQSHDWVTKTGDGMRREKMGMRAAASGGSSGSDKSRTSGSVREQGISSGRSMNPKGGYVDFRGNYWGEAATREMSASEDLADTAAIFDYFDENIGGSGEETWVRDKVDYKGYLKASPLKR